jgi:GAF domain-containing protein
MPDTVGPHDLPTIDAPGSYGDAAPVRRFARLCAIEAHWRDEACEYHQELEMLQAVCDVAAHALDAHFVKVLRPLPGENQLLLVAGVGWGPDEVRHARLAADLGSPAGYALQTGQPIISHRLAGEVRFRTPQLLHRHGIHCAANVIIGSGTRAFGVLEVDSRDERTFSGGEIMFMTGLAATVAHWLALRTAS